MGYQSFTILLIGISSFFVGYDSYAQTDTFKDEIPAFVVSENDTMNVLVIRDMYVYPRYAVYSQKQEEQYRRLIRDVKKTLPYAKMIYRTVIETYEYIMTLPDDKSREEHLKRVERELFTEYKPVFKNLTLSQGKLLIKLVDRECNQSSFAIVKAILGPFRAGFWNLFAGLFGANLKTRWEPDGKDAATERIVQMVEIGAL